MADIKTTICAVISDYAAKKGASLSPSEAEAFLETPSDSKMGDLALPCFKLSKLLKGNPAVISAELAKCFENECGLERVSPTGPYLNFFFKSDKFMSDLEIAVKDEYPELESIGRGKCIAMDFSSPNIAKRFHLGHIGTTVIGNSIRNIYKFLGYNVVAINYLGDWGTQFGKLTVAYKKWSSKEKVEQNGVEELERIYVLFGKEAEKDPSLNDEARAAFAALERGDEELLSVWKSFKEISLREYEKTYKLMGISFDSYSGESFYTDKMPAVVEELREKGLLKIDDGASIVDLSEWNMPPCLILKRDGSTLYPTRDIAAAKWRKREYDFEKCIYVTSAGQSLHFAQWFKVVELMGYDWASGLVHVPYGTMSMGGEKIASRTGNVVHLDDLLAQSVEKCRKILDEKNSGVEDKDEVAKAVGVGAIIFNALSNSRIKDTNFVWEQALSFEGNTGPYVQYTYARCASVLRRGERNKNGFSSYAPASEETELIRKLSEFPDAVKRAADEYEPSVAARYALSVCTLFNQFYHNCRILGSGGEAEQFRLALTEGTRNVLGRCLSLLGMEKTEEI